MPRLAAEAKEARRDHILKAALRCFARRGYHLTTVDDIAAEAGISKGAPYVYFESKEALFQQLHDSWNCELADRIGATIARLSDRDRRSPRSVLQMVETAFERFQPIDSLTWRRELEACASTTLKGWHGRWAVPSASAAAEGTEFVGGQGRGLSSSIIRGAIADRAHLVRVGSAAAVRRLLRL